MRSLCLIKESRNSIFPEAHILKKTQGFDIKKESGSYSFPSTPLQRENKNKFSFSHELKVK